MGASITDPIASDPGIDWTVYGWDYAPLTEALVWEAGLTAAGAQASGGAQDLVKILVDGEFRNDPRDWPGGAGFGSGGGASGGASGGGSDGASGSGSGSAFGGQWSSQTPSDWFARTAPNDEAVLFYARGLQLNHRQLFSVLLAGLAPRLAGFGLPKGDVESELFFGRYSVTPGGIHREGCSNLHLVLSGSKAMHMWRGEEWIPEGTARRVDEEPMAGILENYLPDLDPGTVMGAGTSLRATGGQGFFWRSGTWHVGEAVEPSLALNIASYTGSFEDTSTGLALPLGKDGEVPRDWLADYRSYAGIEDDDARILARTSAVGMRGAGPTETEVTDSPWVVLRSSAPLLWFRDGERLQVATHGQSAEFAADLADWLAELIDRGPGSGISVAVPPKAAACARWLSGQGLLDVGEPC